MNSWMSDSLQTEYNKPMYDDNKTFTASKLFAQY